MAGYLLNGQEVEMTTFAATDESSAIAAVLSQDSAEDQKEYSFPGSDIVLHEAIIVFYAVVMAGIFAGVFKWLWAKRNERAAKISEAEAAYIKSQEENAETARSFAMQAAYEKKTNDVAAQQTAGQEAYDGVIDQAKKYAPTYVAEIQKLTLDDMNWLEKSVMAIWSTALLFALVTTLINLLAQSFNLADDSPLTFDLSDSMGQLGFGLACGATAGVIVYPCIIEPGVERFFSFIEKKNQTTAVGGSETEPRAPAAGAAAV